MLLYSRTNFPHQDKLAQLYHSLGVIAEGGGLDTYALLRRTTSHRCAIGS